MDEYRKVFEGKTIYVAGSRCLENEVLASFIFQETGARCESLSFEQMDALIRQGWSQETRLFLIDALDWRIGTMPVDVPSQTLDPLPSALFSMLFRNGSNGGAPGKTSPGCVCGFFYRSDSAHQFLSSLRALFLGRRAVQDGSPVRFMRLGNSHDQEEGHPLSQREFHILFLMVGGLNNRQIAARLNISSHTVRTHLYNIFRKIDVRNRVQAFLWVHKHVERFFCLM